MLIYLDIKIPHLQIAHLGGNIEVGNIKIHWNQVTLRCFKRWTSASSEAKSSSMGSRWPKIPWNALSHPGRPALPSNFSCLEEYLLGTGQNSRLSHIFQEFWVTLSSVDSSLRYQDYHGVQRGLQQKFWFATVICSSPGISGDRWRNRSFESLVLPSFSE